MYDAIIAGIKDVGFPIMAFLLMFWMCQRTIKDNTKAIEVLSNNIECVILKRK